MAIKEFLTDLACKKATSESSKIRKLHDGRGLYLWVYEDGRKYWRLRYKIHDKEKSLSLGVYPAVGLKQARQLAQAERAKLKSNIDPSIDRQINKQKAKESAANNFEAVAREWYKKQIHTWVKSHSKDVLRRLEGNVFPYIGAYPINTVSLQPFHINILTHHRYPQTFYKEERCHHQKHDEFISKHGKPAECLRRLIAGNMV